MKKEFLTSDLQMASYLALLGHTLTRIERSREPKVFVFADVPQEAVASYYRGDRPVAPQPLFHTYRRLKRELFQHV